MQDEIAVALAPSQILKQLSSVDLSMGTMRAAGVEALVTHAARFSHLKSLNLDDNFIPYTKSHAALREAHGDIVQIGSQRMADSYDDEEYYYTSVAE